MGHRFLSIRTGLRVLTIGTFAACSGKGPATDTSNGASDLLSEDVIVASCEGIADGTHCTEGVCVRGACERVPSCNGKGICLDWPLRGESGRDWVITNYVDLDKNNSQLWDYSGATGALAKTYDGHNGVDISIANFRAMDQGIPVVAAALGQVIEAESTRPDRNTACVTRDANLVVVRHPNGWVAWYGHFRTGSILVKKGQWVKPGEVLGLVGSSGCSTGPHLHLGFVDGSGEVLEPFREKVWTAPPAYDTPIGVMDVSLKKGAFEGLDDIRDPPENQSDFVEGDAVSLGLALGGGKSGDAFRADYRDPTGAVYWSYERSFDKPYTLSYWTWWINAPPGRSGEWTVDVSINGAHAAARTFRIR